MPADPSSIGWSLVKRADLRVSDEERRAVDLRLQQALGEGRLTLVEYEERAGQVYAARTEAELRPLTRDLPGVAGAAAVTAAPLAWRPMSERRSVAVLSGRKLKGVPHHGQRTRAVSFMGHTVIDLRVSALPPVVDIAAYAAMGAVEILVPVGVQVELRGFALMSSKEESIDPPLPGAPVVRVRGFALCGQVTVGHGPRRKRVQLAG